MALSAYVSPRVCPACGKKIEQSESEGRDRIYCNDACKMVFHRRKKTQCPDCNTANALPGHPYHGQIATCYHCGAQMRYTAEPTQDNQKGWSITKRGKKNLRTAASVTK